VAFASLLLFAAARWRARCPRVVRTADLVLTNAVAIVIGLELVCLVWSRLWPSPLVWDESSVASGLNACRQKPGSRWFGLPCNSGGYPDEQFFVAGDQDLVVAVLADSFGLGVVPHAYHFTTVAERRLRESFGTRFQRIAVHDFGIASIGLSHYLYLLDHEVLDYRPQVVAICLFVGNDVLHHAPRYAQSRPLTVQGLLSYQIAARLFAVREHGAAAAQLAAIGASEPGEIPPWIADPSLEPPSFPVEEYMRIEAERFAVLDASATATDRALGRVQDGLDYAQRRLGDRLLVVLIPDEFQVDEQLFEQLLAAAPHPQSIQRELPQRRIRAHCAARGIAVLDLLPALRARAAAGERVYHRRDTHWNAAGNRIGGEALGAWIAQRVGG